MTNHESSQPESSQNNERASLAVEVIEIVQDLLIDEGEEDDQRSDIWRATWEQLQMFSDSQDESDRQFAYNQIHALYSDSLERLYPQLKSVKTAEEMMIELAMIGDVPACDGWFAMSQYRSENGSSRGVSFTVLQLGKAGMAMVASVMDIEDGLAKAYNVALGIDNKMWGGVSVAVEQDDDDEDELLRKIHPGQVSNLVRILHGNIPEYELDMKLAEVRIMSEKMLSEAELDELELYARGRYYAAIDCRHDGAPSGIYDLTLDDLYKVRGMLVERMRQLENDF
ncbi:MAG: hypothetical protein H6797_04155 [Candidatus Nomurabacteria bacterium]|nr:MAG: hypothetical protein H6797_04155 [Candidatus Nomurabacteria bacterium]